MAEPSGRVTDLQSVADLPVDEISALEVWTDQLVHEVSPGSTSLVVRLVSADEMREINRTYRSQDKATDVLSFPGDETPDDMHLGDIVIALAVAERQALELNHPLTVELKTLVLHGVLHCMGYDHETDDGEMERIEDELRVRLISPESTPA